MPFVSINNLPGKLYIPEPEENGKKKYPCPDCVFCQMCNEKKCILCRQHIDDCK